MQKQYIKANIFGYPKTMKIYYLSLHQIWLYKQVSILFPLSSKANLLTRNKKGSKSMIICLPKVLLLKWYIMENLRLSKA